MTPPASKAVVGRIGRDTLWVRRMVNPPFVPVRHPPALPVTPACVELGYTYP
jgi:hypothetical protein